MILLLDTHALLWWLADDPALGGHASEAIASPVNDALVSVASIWEIALKRAKGHLELPDAYIEAIEQGGLSIVSILAADAVRAGRLPAHHRDPFDRMIIAQALRLDAIVVTRDTAFSAYDAPVLPA